MSYKENTSSKSINKKEEKKVYSVINRAEKIKVKITDACNNQINYLNKLVTKDEWSGRVFYSVEGDITDPQNLVITCHHIFPIDIGNAHYTSWNSADKDMTRFMDENFDEMLEKGWNHRGHVHSHNTMSVFFSPEDMSELNDRVKDHNMYFSIIVNVFGDKIAKVAILEEHLYNNIDIVKKRRNIDGIWTEVGNKTGEEMKFEYMCVYDCEVESPTTVGEVDFIKNKVESLSKVKKVNKPQSTLELPFDGEELDWEGTLYDLKVIEEFLHCILLIDTESNNLSTEDCLKKLSLELLHSKVYTTFEEAAEAYVLSVDSIFETLYTDFFGGIDDDYIVSDILMSMIKVLELHEPTYSRTVPVVIEAITTVASSLNLDQTLDLQTTKTLN